MIRSKNNKIRRSQYYLVQQYAIKTMNFWECDMCRSAGVLTTLHEA